MSEPLFQEALDAVVRLATEAPEVPRPGCSDQIHNELRAIVSIVADLIQQPAREPLEVFFGAARRAVFRLEDAISERQADRGTGSYCLGKLTALAEMAQAVLSQKVPEPALRVLIKSQVAVDVASALRDAGSMRVADLAYRLGKAPQNLTPVLRDMTTVGLVRREEIGRTVRLWPTPLTKAALSFLAHPTVAEPETRIHVEARKARVSLPAEARPAQPVQPAGAEPIDPMRAYIIGRSAAIDEMGNADEQLHAARRAASGFLTAYGDRVNRPVQSGESQRDVQERDRVVEAFIRCSKYLLVDSEIRLFGEEPALYLPGVINSNVRGEITVRVAEFFTATDRFSDRGYMPGPVAAHAMARLAELKQAIRVEIRRNS